MVGVIGRLNDNKITFNNEIIKIINKYNKQINPIIVDFNNNPDIEFNKIKPLIDKCNYFILQGGNEFYDIDILIVKYLHESNIPTLGICLGMQIMSMAFNGKMGNINNHLSKEKYVHYVNILNNTLLFKILNKEKILVNSRHKDYIIKTDLDVCAINDIIEAVEDKNKTFFIGVQWHPESLNDEFSNLLFNFFFNS